MNCFGPGAGYVVHLANSFFLTLFGFSGEFLVTLPGDGRLYKVMNEHLMY